MKKQITITEGTAEFIYHYDTLPGKITRLESAGKKVTVYGYADAHPTPESAVQELNESAGAQRNNLWFSIVK